MKFQIEIDCTPEEARQFLGLPDVVPMQEALMQQLQDRLSDALAGRDTEALLKAWLPAGVQGLDQMQKAFWSQFMAPKGEK
tara:strand:+ start:534 stop:776 length:243 start_codon:yes stop_codon:yes gene_type:complete